MARDSFVQEESVKTFCSRRGQWRRHEMLNFMRVLVNKKRVPVHLKFGRPCGVAMTSLWPRCNAWETHVSRLPVYIFIKMNTKNRILWHLHWLSSAIGRRFMPEIDSKGKYFWTFVVLKGINYFDDEVLEDCFTPNKTGEKLKFRCWFYVNQPRKNARIFALYCTPTINLHLLVVNQK